MAKTRQRQSRASQRNISQDEYDESLLTSAQRRRIRREGITVRQFLAAGHEPGNITAQHKAKKSWTIHDLVPVSPCNESQRQMMDAFQEGDHVLAVGSAGTGKTFLAVFLALNSMLSSDPDSAPQRIVLVRSAVPTRDIGFLPGDQEEKQAVYEAPYEDIFAELLKRKSSYKDMKAAGKVEFMLTSFIRGITLDNCVIIFDECQSANFNEIYSVLTRVGKNTRIIICGDAKQDDLHAQRNTNKSGIQDLMKVAQHMKNIDIVNFTENDIVRSGFVKDFIIACQRNLSD